MKANKHILLFLIISGPLFMDFINGIVNPSETGITVGQLLRGIYLVILIILLLSHRPGYWQIGFIWAWILIFFKEVVTFFIARDFVWSMELSIILKAWYAPLVAFFIFWLMERMRTIKARVLYVHMCIYGAIISIGVVIGKILGVGYTTYPAYSYGSTGILLSPNDPGLSLVIALTAATWMIIKGKSQLRFVPFGLIVWALITIGTRASLIGIVLVPAIIGLVMVFMKDLSIRTPSYTWKVIGIVLVVAFLGNLVLEHISSNEYIAQKFMSLLAGENPRKTFEAGLERILERPLLFNLLGEGVVSFMSHVEEIGYFPTQSPFGKRTEVDWLDLIGFFGIPMTIVIYSFYIIFLIRALRSLVVKRHSEYLVAVIAMSVFLGHSVLAGHALYKPLPGGAIAPVIALLMVEKINKEKTCASR